MRILLLSLHFAPDTVSNAVVVTELAEELDRRGHHVTVVAALPYHQAHTIEPGYRHRLWQGDWHGSIRVFRTWLYLRGHKGDLTRRFLAYATFNVTSTLVASVLGPYDVVITPSPPLTIGLCGWLLARLWGAKFVYNVQDIYPDAAVKLGLLRDPRLIHFFARLERFVYDRADCVTVLSEDFRRNLLAKGVPDAKLRLIPNGVDADFIRSLPRTNAFAQQHCLIGRFVVLYAGNIGLAQGIDTLLDAAVCAESTDIRVLLVGAGAALERVRARAAATANGRVRLLPFQARAQVPEMYASADVGVVVLGEGMADTSAPSKLYSIMAAGLPVVASVDSGSGVWRLVESVGCGVSVPANDPRALGHALDSIRRMSDADRRCLGERGRRYIEAHHTRQRIGEDYHRLLDELRGGGGADTAVNSE